MIQCPFHKLACPTCYIEEYTSCARYQLAIVKGALAIPEDMSVLDYARIPGMIRSQS